MFSSNLISLRVRTTMYLLLFLWPYVVSSQIRFRLEKTSVTAYRVCAVSEQSYKPPGNSILSAQVTFKVKSSNKFEFGHLQSKYLAEQWKVSPKIKHAKSPDNHFISINVENEGKDYPPIVAKECVELFTFENVGDPKADIELIENADYMVKNPREVRLNLGNEISILGYEKGLKNAYVENLPTISIETTTPINLQKAYPNPTESTITLDWIYQQKVEVTSLSVGVSDPLTGRQVKLIQTETQKNGQNSTTVDLSDIPPAEYIIYLLVNGQQSNALHFVKK